MISRELAVKFIEHVTKYTEYNVNIMDQDGVIIASRDPERVGQYHEVAYRIINSMEDIVDTTSDHDYPNVLPGINMVIMNEGSREGVVGVTGDPAEIRPVALIVKMAIETMLKYERSQELLRLRESKKERFIYFLTQVEHSDPAEVRQLARELGYPEEMIRIPLLIRLKKVDPEEALRRIRQSPSHTRMDVSFVLSPHHLIVFKTVPSSPERLFADYKYLLGEYMSPFLNWIRVKEENIKLYVGSFQNSYSRYYASYQHCKWLERNIHNQGISFFFYDYTGQHLQELVPMKELQQIYYLYGQGIPSEKIKIYMEIIGALLNTNFNFSKAAASLYIHKNTLVYRYNQLKETLDMDPMSSPGDRAFLGGLFQYFSRRGRGNTFNEME